MRTSKFTSLLYLLRMLISITSAFFNDISYVTPIVPTIFSTLTTGTQASNPTIYGINSSPFILAHNEVVEIVLNNYDTGRHPFHLHGHAFQAVARSPENAGVYAPTNTTFAQIPMRRDVFVAEPQGNFVLRFRSDNPGVSPSFPPFNSISFKIKTRLTAA